MRYAEVEDLRTYLKLADGYIGDDPAYEDALEVASRQIDAYCGSLAPFGPPDPEAAPTPRIMRGAPGPVLRPGPIASTTGVTVETSSDRTTWTSIDDSRWFLGPDDRPNGWAWTEIETINGTRWGSRWVRVTASWGWPAVPAQVSRATLLTAHWILQRPNAPFGVQGFADFAARVPAGGDPDVRRLLAPFRDALIA